VPIYRQITLTGLCSAQISAAAACDLAYNDVLSGWHNYLLHDNDARGVMIIGPEAPTPAPPGRNPFWDAPARPETTWPASTRPNYSAPPRP
jgi:hypothetical protein